MSRRRDGARRGRATLLWALIAFAVLQLGLNVAMEQWRPALRDPEFGFKLQFLRDRLAEAPQKPLLLVLGSSRSGLGIRPDVLRLQQSLLFNFAQTGAGPIWELLTLQRLLDQRIQPHALLVEVFPMWLHQEGSWREEAMFDIRRFSRSDVRLLERYSEDPDELRRRWFESRWVPSHTHRYSILSWYAADWLPDRSREDGWTAMDPYGWLPYTRPIGDAQERERAIEQARQEYDRALTDYRICPQPDRALRDLISLARARNIPLMLLVMPEGSVFQSWYATGPRQEIDRYLTELSRTTGVPLVDARDWLPDDAFFDGHHLYPHGSEAFTRRLGREVIPTLLRARKSRGE